MWCSLSMFHSCISFRTLKCDFNLLIDIFRFLPVQALDESHISSFTSDIVVRYFESVFRVYTLNWRKYALEKLRKFQWTPRCSCLLGSYRLLSLRPRFLEYCQIPALSSSFLHLCLLQKLSSHASSHDHQPLLSLPKLSCQGNAGYNGLYLH